MKRIFFYGNILIEDQSSGISKKVLSQISTLRNMGYEVFYTGYVSDGVAIFNNSDEIVRHDKYKFKSNKVNRFLRRWNLLTSARNFIEENEIKFDYGYLRFHFFDRAYLRLLKEIKQNGGKVIIEAHSFPYRNKRLNPLIITHIIDYIYEPFVRKYIDLVAAMSSEQKIWDCETIQIDNAIDLENILLQDKEIHNSKEIRLISVSNERYYHGYSKLIKGLYEYYNDGGNYNIIIRFIGDFRTETEELVRKLNMEKHIKFLGKKYGSELDYYYNNSDIGIGALSSRAGVEHGSSIKTKEYFAKGLPFINGWREYAFDDTYPYVKRFSLEDEYIDFTSIINFYISIKEDIRMQKNMRDFAEKNYTWMKQFKKVFSELEQN